MAESRSGEGLGHLNLVHGSLTEGWRYSDAGAEISPLTDTEIFGFNQQRRAAAQGDQPRGFPGRTSSPARIVAHIDHGIARFVGLVHMTHDGNEREYLELHSMPRATSLCRRTNSTASAAKHRPSDRVPQSARLSSGDWQRAKQRVKRAVALLAKRPPGTLRRS